METVVEENGQSPLILLVEDNVELRSFIRTCLGSGYRYSEAGNGRDGMSLAMNQIPDLIISDLMMPEMDGLELCARLKKDKRTDHIPFIMLTAKAAEENKLEGLQTGADEYLVKPFNKAELLLKVQNLITLRQNLQTRIRTEILAKASEIRAESAGEQFVLKARLFVEAHAKDEDLSVETLSQEMNLSREQCYRKISALTGLTPSAFIRKIKLQRAHQLLSSKWGPVSQVAYESGFENLSYFSKAFKEEFGMLPSEL
jgi:DNA-binding response OmpR family regulator